MAAIQLAEWAQSGTDTGIRNAINNVEDKLMTLPIHEVRISTSDPSKIIVEFHAEEEGPIKQKRLALSTFIRKVQGVIASSR
jgi:nitrate reductase NapAB chaperone NapD